MSTLVLLGSTGRIGRIVAAKAAEAGFEIATVDRIGTVQIEGNACGNIWSTTFDLGRKIHLADCSIDYSSVERMVALEKQKRVLVARLADKDVMSAYLTISSGAVEFDDSLIQSDFHLDYKRQKLANEALARALGSRSYSPRVYALIGPETFKVKSVGWVNVIEQCLAGNHVTIDKRNEPRSWLSEAALGERVAQWLQGTQSSIVETPSSGTFCMSEIVDYMRVREEKQIEVFASAMAGWLTVPYVTSAVSEPVSLEETLELCLKFSMPECGDIGMVRGTCGKELRT